MTGAVFNSGDAPLEASGRSDAGGKGPAGRRLRPLSRAWVLAPALALAFTLWADAVRLRRVEYVSNLARDDARVDRASPTGYADGRRWLIVPEHNNPTYQWIEETQLMLARGDWRVRRVDYENAPFGRDVFSASPYRWWLVLVAACDRAVGGGPLGLSVERSALFADPLLQVALLIAGTALVAWRFGRLSAALFSLGLAGFFPFAAAFLPGVANDFGLRQVIALLSVLPLVAGATAGPRAARWFALAGVAGGCGLWLGAAGQAPIIAGIAAGAVLGAFVARGGATAPLPWRAWAMAGALTSFAAYLVEFFPGHMEAELRVNYPLYGLAWLGLGELLARITPWARGSRLFGSPRAAVACLISAAGLASLPAAIWWKDGRAFFADDLLSARLTNLPGGAVATGFLAWLESDAPAGALAATCLPLLVAAPAAWILLRGRADAARRMSVALALGPVAVSLAFALWGIRWWNTVDALLLVLLVAASAAAPAAEPSRIRPWLWSALVGGILAAGVPEVAPSPVAPGSRGFQFSRAEVEGLYERMLSHWIADHAGPDGATVLAPPLRTSSLCFYGGLRGLATQNWENRDGLLAAFHIASTLKPDESRVVMGERGVTHIVLPSWDTDLENFARARLKNPEQSFVYILRRTDGGAFDWLRPLPFELPPVAGLGEQSALVLEVTEETDPATVQSRLVEYLLEMHQADKALGAGQALLRYPADLGSLVALAQLAKARGDEEGFSKAFHSIVSGLANGTDRGLAWDRRVSLAVALAIGGRDDLASAQVRRCFGEIDGARVRDLTTESLYHLLVLGKRYGVEPADPKLRELAIRLIPAKWRRSL